MPEVNQLVRATGSDLVVSQPRDSIYPGVKLSLSDEVAARHFANVKCLVSGSGAKH